MLLYYPKEVTFDNNPAVFFTIKNTLSPRINKHFCQPHSEFTKISERINPLE
jgi:hypothetical protein